MLIFCFTISYFTISSCVAIQRYPFVNTQQNFLFKLHLLIQKKHLNGVTFCLFTCALHIQTKRCRCGHPTVDTWPYYMKMYNLDVFKFRIDKGLSTLNVKNIYFYIKVVFF